MFLLARHTLVLKAQMRTGRKASPKL
uniref:Uncharacterized protein n=1 Tax=Arundo donax TaxID=35708 RepID=A0A0A9BZP6_ARUDO